MAKNRLILLVLIVCGLTFAWPIQYFYTHLDKPAEQKQLRALDKLAEDLLDLTKKGEWESAREKLRQLAEDFPNQTLPTRIRLESLNAVTQSILAAGQVFEAYDGKEEKLLWHATQVRVAIDALSHTHQPMWKAYYTSFTNQMQNLLQSAVERDSVQFRAQFEENYRLYLTIRPAMSVHLQAGQIEKIGEAYQLLQKGLRSDPIEWKEVRVTLRDLHTEMQSAFNGEDKSTFAAIMDPRSPLLLISSVFTLVALALIYVGWKKYEGRGTEVL